MCVTMPNLAVQRQRAWVVGDITIGYPQKWGALGRPTTWDGACLTLYKHVPPHVGYLTVQNLIELSRTIRKIGNSRPACQGHSRSSKFTLIDRVPMTSYINVP